MSLPQPIALLALLALASPAQTGPLDLEQRMLAARDRLGAVMDDPAGHRVQVIYTRVGRSHDGDRELLRERFRIDPDGYFYPASVIKFPIAVAALEWLNDLDVPGLDRDTTMLTDAVRPAQTPATEDATAPRGMPSVAHYIRKLSIVSDNDASNRLFELLGTDELKARLARWGMTETRLTHRLAVRLPPEENRHFNPVRFVDQDGIVHAVPARTGANLAAGVEPIPLGVGELIAGAYVEGPKDFAGLNHMPLAEVHGLLEAIVFPDLVPEATRPGITTSDRALLLEAMRVMPSESDIEAYRDADRFPDGFANYFIMGRDPSRLPKGVTITNKVGRAYGFLTETAHIVDSVYEVEFLLSATVHVNANRIYNDDDYEYDELGFPFLAELGRLMLEHARKTR